MVRRVVNVHPMVTGREPFSVFHSMMSTFMYIIVCYFCLQFCNFCFDINLYLSFAFACIPFCVLSFEQQWLLGRMVARENSESP